MRTQAAGILLAMVAALCAPRSIRAEDTLHIGSKRFTESYVLAEVLTQTAAPFATVEHLAGLGNTAILFEALRQGSIDLYPEYTGTIELEILKHSRTGASVAAIDRELAQYGLGIAIPFGFNNTYALGTRRGAGPSPTSVSQLRTLPQLRFGLSHEFLGRADGWSGLAQRYQLPQTPIGLDHGLAYEALANGQIDVLDVYATDAKIARFDIQILSDDLHYFPRYDAVVLYRRDVPVRFPKAWAALTTLSGRIDESHMIAMNGAVELGGASFAEVAHRFVGGDAQPGTRHRFIDKLFGDDFWPLTIQHLGLVLFAVLAATLVGVPLGIASARSRRSSTLVSASVGVLQTIPALALLAFLIPLMGRVGTLPALVALFIYALLPIVRNTQTAILQVPSGMRFAAQALGLSAFDQLVWIEIPLALRVILAGIKTATVISVGTATLAALIGAGGYGQRITVGLALNDYSMLLAGALPAAALALLFEGAFLLLDVALERRLQHH